MNRIELGTSVKVIGVGGGGTSAVDWMIDMGLSRTEFIAANFDIQSLRLRKATVKLELKSLYPGLTFPEFGDPARIRRRESSMAMREQIRKAIGKADLMFIIAGLGGGTGSGAAPVIAEIAREAGALTVGVVTRPFVFEGKERAKVAEASIKDLSRYVDTLIVIPNDGILKMMDIKEMSVAEAFHLCDERIVQAVQCILGLIFGPCLFTPLSFNDIAPLLRSRRGGPLAGRLGIGWASGKNRVKEATYMAINSPLLEEPFRMASGVLIGIVCSPELPLSEIDEAVGNVVAASKPDARILHNATINNSLKDELRITVVCLYEQHELRIAV